MKKILATIAIIVLMIVGMIQIDKYRVKSITHGEEGKAAIENMLKIMDEKAFTSEGKIKSYKIDESYTKNNYTHRNPMGGVSVKIVINGDESLYLGTILNKYPSSKEYDLGVFSFSPELRKLIYR